MTLVFKPGVWDRKALLEEMSRIIQAPSGDAQDKAQRILDILGTYKVIK